MKLHRKIFESIEESNKEQLVNLYKSKSLQSYTSNATNSESARTLFPVESTKQIT